MVSKGSSVNIANRTDPAKGNDSGMAGVYSVHDGSITLAGTPAKPGIYDISVTITDELGRTATSNTLPFRIYSGEETLQDQLTLANCTKTADGKQTIFFDLSNLGKTWFTDDVIKQIMPHLEKHIGINSTEEFIFAIPVSTDDEELSIDMEFNRTHVYSAKTGKKLYTLKSVSGFRIAEYKRNIFGVVSNNSIPVSVVTYGTLDNTWKKATRQDIEI